MWPTIVIVQEGFVISAEFGSLIIGRAVPDRISCDVGLHRMARPVDRLDRARTEQHELTHQPFAGIDDEIAVVPMRQASRSVPLRIKLR